MFIAPSAFAECVSKFSKINIVIFMSWTKNRMFKIHVYKKLLGQPTLVLHWWTMMWIITVINAQSLFDTGFRQIIECENIG